MQNIENDMDDLFRRASEKYPLNTGRGDWESIEKRLSVAPLSDIPQKQKKNNNYKKLLLLLLLVCFSFLIGFMISNSNNRNYQGGIADKQTDPKGDLNKNPEIKNNLTNDQSSKEIKKTATFNEKKEISPDYKPSKEDRIVSPILIKFASTFKNNKNITLPNPDNSLIENTEKLSKTKYEALAFENNAKKTVQDDKGFIEKNVSPDLKKKLSTTKAKVSKENIMYAGLIAGPDFSKVQTGPFNGPGLSAGIIAGYKINSKFFLETGFSIDTKYYYSKGNFFNKAAASMPDGMTVNNLESRSKILEIPLKIGYVFYRKKNTNLFLATGIATYLMTKEKNNYNITENGNPGKMEGIYEKNNLKMPAVINISAGWEHHLSGLLKIRIEPYLKLPLQGIGVGKLPVTSAGIQIGVFRQFK